MARSANRAKDEFLAVMNHELRSPLISVLGYAQIINHELMGSITKNPETYKQYAAEIETSGNHLLTIINEILNFSKVSADKMELNPSEQSVSPLFLIAKTLTSGQAELKHIGYAIAPTAARLMLDDQLAKQMLINLISNAIKFSPAGTTIHLSTEPLPDGGLALCVRDEGQGIAPENLDKVLQPFVQVEDVFTRENAAAGTGLGLPYVKKLMELHGGTLRLESALGVGTTARLEFPAERVLAL